MSFSDVLRFFASGRESAFADPESRFIAERWLEYGDLNGMWEKMLRAQARHLEKKGTEPAPASPRLSEKEFIQVVLSARHGIERLIAHEAKTRKDFEDAKNCFAEQIKLAESPQDVEQAIAEFKSKFEVLNASVYDFNAPTPVSRKDQNGSRTTAVSRHRLVGKFPRLQDDMAMLVQRSSVKAVRRNFVIVCPGAVIFWSNHDVASQEEK